MTRHRYNAIDLFIFHCLSLFCVCFLRDEQSQHHFFFRFLSGLFHLVLLMSISCKILPFSPVLHQSVSLRFYFFVSSLPSSLHEQDGIRIIEESLRLIYVQCLMKCKAFNLKNIQPNYVFIYYLSISPHICGKLFRYIKRRRNCAACLK